MTTDSDQPLVSFVIAVYNDERHLPRAVKSVQAQTYKNWELVIVDDGSTDGTLLLARRLAEGNCQIRVIAAEHGGPAHARNVGLREARGEWIAILDSDDYAHPDRIERQLEFARAHPEAGCVGSYARRVTPAGVDWGLIPAGPTTPEIFERQRDYGAIRVVHSSLMVRRDLALQSGGYPELYELSEDIAFFNLRIAPLTQILVDPTPLVTNEVNRDSITHRVAQPAVSYDEIIRLNARRRIEGKFELDPVDATRLILAGTSRWSRWTRERRRRSFQLRLRAHALLAARSPLGIFPLIGSWILTPIANIETYRRKLRTVRWPRMLRGG